MTSEPRTQSRRLAVAWVVGSSIIWAAVVGATGDVGWPLVVWALTTFAPLAELRRRHENPSD